MLKMTTVKKAMILLSMGGATFLFGFGFGPEQAPTCVSNADIVGLYQTVGEQGIESFRDATVNAWNIATGTTNTDFETWIINPVANLITDGYDNWVDNQFPEDL